MRQTLINNFIRISKIPRESGHEEKIANFFVDIAKKNNLYSFKDENNNVLIKKRGNISSQPLALQAHLDMVCVKTKDSKHNFETDGINVEINNDIVTAKDTSLEADQGVGLAIMLTIMEAKNLNHPDLEFLLTTEEETTFNGVVTFPYSKVKSRHLINLDNDKDNTVLVASAGDICNEYILRGELLQNNLPAHKILIADFPSGNSGINISLSEKNAITTMAKLLKNKEIFLKSIKGGTNENDIASSCEVIINTNLPIESLFKKQNAEITKINNNISFSKEDTQNILNQILALKCGFLSSNTSANLGVINTINNEVKITYLLRSIEEQELKDNNKEINKLTYKFNVINKYQDSIWPKNHESLLLNKYKEVYYNEYSVYPKEEISHGGLECSSINKRISNLDIISIGSNLKNIHTVDETTYISSWLKTYKLLINLLEVLYKN